MPHLKATSAEYLVSPTVVPDGWRGTLRISGDYEHTRFLPGVIYSYEMQSMFFRATGSRRKAAVTGTAAADQTGILYIPFQGDIAGEWHLTVQSEQDNRKNMPMSCAVYVLPRPLYAYRPFIGELHSHSTASDGAQEPAYPPLRARTFGCDFFALTDHWCYTSSSEMKERAGRMLGKSMLLLNGEEMHPEREILKDPERAGGHYHHYHYVAVGHRKGVRDTYLENPEACDAEIRTVADELVARGIRSDIDVVPYAEGVWKVRKAKELGALTVLAHPYWSNPVNLDAAAIEQSLEDRETDAVEAVSSADESSYMPNRLAAASTTDGRPHNVVGVSDSHSWVETRPFQCCTFVMAEELSREALLEAVRGGRSLACRMTDPIQLVGPFELVDFATFYLQRILPMRRRITELQGKLGLSELRADAARKGASHTGPVGAYSQKLMDDLGAELAALDAAIWRANE